MWDLNNKTTREAGGEHCCWIGMIGGSPLSEAPRFRDIKAVCERTPILLLDWQSRRHTGGFEANGDAGKLLHGVLGWEKLIPESMAMYEHAHIAFRVASKSVPEARLWAFEGFAGGIQPWWHHIGAYHDDRRQYRTAEPIFTWHEQNEQFLLNRTPIASVGFVWSQDNVDFYGRDDGTDLVGHPWLGFSRAMISARIPYLPVHIDHVPRDSARFKVLVLPHLAALSDKQALGIRRFVEGGGSLVATGEAGCYDEWGQPRGQSPLADLLGVRFLGTYHGDHHRLGASWADWRQHTYLRLTPELRAGVYGPKCGDEPKPKGVRHPCLNGFAETDILPLGGRLEAVAVTDDKARVPAWFVPSFPIFPPETSWMRRPTSGLPGVVVREHPAGGRIAYLAADIDRCYGRDNLPDHAQLLQNLVRWAAADDMPLRVEGPGLLDCHLFEQPGRRILHIVNLTATGLKPITEHIPVGPVRVTVGTAGKGSVRLLVSGNAAPAQAAKSSVTFEIPRIADHEVAVIS